MSEMAMTADHLIVIGRGRLIADISVADFTKQASSDLVHVRSPAAERLRELLVGSTVHVTVISPGRLEVIGLTSDEIGDIASANMIPLHELVPQQASLEHAFMTLTHDSVEYHPSEVAAS
jgi:ABC-2 type transport system ATP-binding protein